jgi:hypothetical protein
MRPASNQLQAAYQLQVAPYNQLEVFHQQEVSPTTHVGFTHDSGRIASSQSTNVGLLAAAVADKLAPGTTYSWRVRTWTSEDEASALPSRPAEARSLRWLCARSCH